MAKQKTTPPPGTKPQPRQHSLVWVQGLLCGAMATLATPTALLLGVLLGPALLAILLDHEPGRPRARSIALCSMAASIDPLRTLWTVGHTIATATALLSNVRVVGIAWSAAAAGWLLAEIIPIGVRAALEGVSVARASRLNAERAKLVETWGLDAPQDD
ncbi:MAG TPA: hypothetical protein VK822_16300 [Acetobacteraceae bacterium]|jgi:hypothetical protein|nr:hypothetical protein [Acetobacteraceae bacterium]